MKDYAYPLDIEWSTEEMIRVMDLWSALEQAYEQGISNQEFLKKYQLFKTVVKSIGEERRIGKDFELISGYSLYQAVKTAKNNEKMTLRMKG
ncbi:UPF0223 family protein [Enterococcus sp. LJL98]